MACSMLHEAALALLTNGNQDLHAARMFDFVKSPDVLGAISLRLDSKFDTCIRKLTDQGARNCSGLPRGRLREEIQTADRDVYSPLD